MSVAEQKWRNDEAHIPSDSWISPDLPHHTIHVPTDHNYLTLDTFMFHTSKLESQTMTTVYIPCLLRKYMTKLHTSNLSLPRNHALNCNVMVKQIVL